MRKAGLGTFPAVGDAPGRAEKGGHGEGGYGYVQRPVAAKSRANPHRPAAAPRGPPGGKPLRVYGGTFPGTGGRLIFGERPRAAAGNPGAASTWSELGRGDSDHVEFGPGRPKKGVRRAGRKNTGCEIAGRRRTYRESVYVAEKTARRPGGRRLAAGPAPFPAGRPLAGRGGPPGGAVHWSPSCMRVFPCVCCRTCFPCPMLSLTYTPRATYVR